MCAALNQSEIGIDRRGILMPFVGRPDATLEDLGCKNDYSLFAMITLALSNRTYSVEQPKSACLLVLISVMIRLGSSSYKLLSINSHEYPIFQYCEIC